MPAVDPERPEERTILLFDIDYRKFDINSLSSVIGNNPLTLINDELIAKIDELKQLIGAINSGEPAFKFNDVETMDKAVSDLKDDIEIFNSQLLSLVNDFTSSFNDISSELDYDFGDSKRVSIAETNLT